MSKVVLTYGTFDLFHIGHLNLLERLKDLGDILLVGVATDSYNEAKGKKSVIKYEDRAKIVKNIKCVDGVFPETELGHKIEDIKKYNADVFGIGWDHHGKFDYLKDHCEVVYLPRTEGVSTSILKNVVTGADLNQVKELNMAVDIIRSFITKFE